DRHPRLRYPRRYAAGWVCGSCRVARALSCPRALERNPDADRAALALRAPSRSCIPRAVTLRSVPTMRRSSRSAGVLGATEVGLSLLLALLALMALPAL